MHGRKYGLEERNVTGSELYGSVHISFHTYTRVSMGTIMYICGLQWEHSHTYTSCSGNMRVHTWVAVGTISYTEVTMGTIAYT